MGADSQLRKMAQAAGLRLIWRGQAGMGTGNSVSRPGHTEAVRSGGSTFQSVFCKAVSASSSDAIHSKKGILHYMLVYTHARLHTHS